MTEMLRRRKTKPIRARAAPLGIWDCGLGIRGCRGRERQTNPIFAGRGIGGHGPPHGMGGERPDAGHVKQSQFAQGSPGGAGRSREIRNPKQIRNANDRNKPKCAKQTQFAAGQEAPRRHRERGEKGKYFSIKRLRVALCVLCDSVVKNGRIRSTMIETGTKLEKERVETHEKEKTKPIFAISGLKLRVAMKNKANLAK